VASSTGLKSDVILGYRILKRIGAGGFGEVWAAEAPGGLQKAVKILYGYHDERRAQDELKSLDRIKQLRHPFLLSLERIEVVDKQLVVITELADRSLGDVFDGYVSSGQEGIPREELLEYLRQAADALDFLSAEHKLQHLDVKPENLLLVGKHAKLADFGLVKDLRDNTQSLMGGLTPQFAAPELFDGRPSMQSDQYALAIVFQEMLTGKRPFNGSTLAQLAAQHMHAQPDLSSLPKGDRATIARALSKKPELRFPSCRVMIDELADQRLISRKQKRSQIPSRRSEDTAVQPAENSAAMLSGSTCMFNTAAMHGEARQLQLVEPPAMHHVTHGMGPTLIVGIGRLGTRIVQRLKRMACDRLGPLHKLGAIRLLCLDTDRISLTDATTCTGELAPLEAGETLSLPLRRPEEYRTRSDRHKNWLNRRWIYNVPKTLQTEGLRPLGRLALIDNFPAVIEQLQSVIGAIAPPEVTAQTADQLGVEALPQRARVFLIGAISGGVASGTLLDLAYTIRLLLEEHSLRSASLHGLFLHGTRQQQADSGIPVANTFAFLTELRHCVQQGYPGEESCGIPPLDEDPPFDYSYFLNLGTEQPEKELNQRIDNTAEYLFLNVFTRAAPFFDSCRELESDIDHFALRSFGLARIGPGEQACHDLLTEVLRNRLLDRWTAPRPDLPLRTPLLDSFVHETGGDQLLAGVQADIDRAIPAAQLADAEQLLQQWAFVPTSPERSADEAVTLIDALYGELPRDGKAPLQSLNDDVADALATRGKLLCQLAERAIVELFSQPRLSLGQTRQRLDAALAALEQERSRLSASIVEKNGVQQKLQSMLKSLRHRPRPSSADESNSRLIAASLLTNRREAFVQRCACEVLLAAVRRLGSLKTDVARMDSETVAALQSPLRETSDRAALARFNGLQRVLAGALLARSEVMLDRIEHRIWLELVQPTGSYWSLFQSSGSVRRHLARAAEQAASAELSALGKSLELDEALATCLEARHQGTENEVASVIARARPMLDDCGGSSRMLVAIPANSSSTRLPEEAFAAAGVQGTVVPATTGDLVIALETEDVALAEVAYRLLETRTDCVELARRLQSRNDVNWRSLEDLL
jgi:eukaryotic-like serine/threonine-protein kinase